MQISSGPRATAQCGSNSHCLADHFQHFGCFPPHPINPRLYHVAKVRQCRLLALIARWTLESSRQFLVPSKGLEPPHRCRYMDLNHARLPIPPRWQYWTAMQRRPQGRRVRKINTSILQPRHRLSNQPSETLCRISKKLAPSFSSV